jgi:predicted site-specific integrase-resolvase
METNFLTQKQVAQLFQVCINTVRNWEKQGRIKRSEKHPGQRPRYEAQQFEKFVNPQTEQHGS